MVSCSLFLDECVVLLAVGADREVCILEAPPAVNRSRGRLTEILQEDQILQVVSESVQRVGEAAKVGPTLERVAVLQQSPAGSLIVVDERIVHPLAHLVGQRRDILREGSHLVDVSKVGVSLGSARVTKRAVVAADAAGKVAARGQISVIGKRYGEAVRRNGAVTADPNKSLPPCAESLI